MADEFHGNWWDSARNRVQSTRTAPTSVSTRLNAIAGFDWPAEMADMKSRSSMESVTVSGGDGGGMGNTNLQMMGLGLSSQVMDWNQALSLGEKTETSFRSLLEEDNNFRQVSVPAVSSSSSSSQEHWLQKLYAVDAVSVKQMDPPQFSSQASSNDSTITSHSGYQVDSSAAYGLLIPPENHPYQSVSYATEFNQSWNRFPPAPNGSHLHFTNNTPFWNASAAMNDARSGFFPQIPLPPSFNEKNSSEARDPATLKKTHIESSNKRSRNEAPSPLLACNKVKKEKMGDRITALQQLVSPFGKTDTASVLSEAIEYIKFLHEQVSVLSTPYMKHQQNLEKSKDLTSRGLCLVPVSSTFPVTQETTVDFWTPTFGGTFR